MRIGLVHAWVGLSRLIEQATSYEVAWIALDGEQALEMCRQDAPDLLLLDVLLAKTDHILTNSPCPILIVTASVGGALGKVSRAMAAGALDAVDTPNSGSGEAFVATLEMLARGLGLNREARLPYGTPTPCPLIAIGSSAGGPAALAVVLAGLPADLSACLVIVQHIDAGFTPDLASWLDEHTSLTVSLAREGQRPSRGQVLLAGQPAHLLVKPEGTLTYGAERAGDIHCPSVDVFFQSVAEHWTGSCVGVLLTGMGRDGARGLLALRQRGYHTIAQDEETSAIYGMPMAAAELGAACEVLPLPQIARVLQLGLTGHYRETRGERP